MITKSADEINRAIKLYDWLRPDATKLARKRFAAKAARHLAYDYKGSQGLKLVGYGDCECTNSIIFDDFQDEELGTEVCFSVTVKAPDGNERFDSDEALGYNTFIQAAPHREELQAAIIKQHFREKRDERCED